MPTRPPPDYPWGGRPSGRLVPKAPPFWLMMIAGLAVCVFLSIVQTVQRHDERRDRYWSDLALIYDAGRIGMCEAPVDPQISETCTQLKAAR